MADPTNLLRTQLENLGAEADAHVYDDFNKADDYEIWDLEGKFLGAGLHFYRHCPYTMNEPLKGTWNQMFTRAPDMHALLCDALDRLVNGATIIFDALPYHSVHAVAPGTAKTPEVRIKSISMLRDSVTDHRFGFLMITHYRYP